MSITISVIMPVHNAKPFLSFAIESVLAQTLQGIELIAVNDGSTDGSDIILDSYQNKYPEQIHVIHTHQGGAGAARNEGLKIARGTYVAFMDSDDWVSKTMYQELYILAEKGYDIVICNAIRAQFENDLQAYELKAYRGNTPLHTEDFIKNACMSAAPWNKLFRRSFLESTALLYPHIPYEDVAYIPAVFSYASSFAYLDKGLYYYRVNESSVTANQAYEDKILQKLGAYQEGLRLASPKTRHYILYSILSKVESDTREFPAYRWYYNEFKKNLIIKYRNDYHLEKFMKNINLMNSAPACLHICCAGKFVEQEYINRIRANLDAFTIYIWDSSSYDFSTSPEIVKKAYESGNFEFVNDYIKLDVLYQFGGIAIDPCIEPCKKIACCLEHQLVFGSSGWRSMHTHVMSAYPNQDFILTLITTYFFSPYSNEYLPLHQRLSDYLFSFVHLKINGLEQEAPSWGIKIFPPSRLLDNLDKNTSLAVYTKNDSLKAMYHQSVCDEYRAMSQQNPGSSARIRQLEQQIALYEKSTCWKITRPIRVIGDIIKRLKRRSDK